MQIPEEELDKLAKLCRLPDSSFAELVAALKQAPVTSQPTDMASKIAANVPSIPIEDLLDFVGVLYSLHYVREFSGVGAKRFLDDLNAAVKESPNVFGDVERAKAKGRLKTVMSIETLNNLSKAVGLQRGGERLFCGSRILSDIRPIFMADAKLRPTAAVITHTLSIGYHEGKDHKEFYVVLDTGDLKSLKDVIDRAYAKRNSMEALLSDAKLEDLGI